MIIFITFNIWTQYLDLHYKLRYIYSVIRQGYHLQTNLKHLDPSHKSDLSVWKCFVVKTHLSVELHWTGSEIKGHFIGVIPSLTAEYKQETCKERNSLIRICTIGSIF